MFFKHFFDSTPEPAQKDSLANSPSGQDSHTVPPGKNPGFNLVHILDTGAMHGLQGYRELIDTIAWGLTHMGANTTITENALQTDRVNIVFGAQVLPVQELLKLPNNTIIYNLEQMGGLDLSGNPVARAISQHFLIWDYSESNLNSWKILNPSHPVIHVPVGWAPILNRIPKPALQDIDILIYGKPGPFRLQVFNDLCQRGLKSLFVCGLYGQARDELIARSKLVLNINLYDHSRIFEIVRVSYLLANGKAVVADFREGSHVDHELTDAVAFAPPEKIVETCIALLHDNDRRELLETRGKQIMERRNIVPILETALASGRTAI